MQKTLENEPEMVEDHTATFPKSAQNSTKMNVTNDKLGPKTNARPYMLQV